MLAALATFALLAPAPVADESSVPAPRLDALVWQARSHSRRAVAPGAWQRLSLLPSSHGTELSLLGRAWSTRMDSEIAARTTPLREIGLALAFALRPGLPALFLGIATTFVPGARAGVGLTTGIVWPIPSLVSIQR